MSGSLPRVVGPDTTIDDYLNIREEFIASERNLRRDRLRLENATPEELEADKVIRAIRLEEEKTIWSVEHEEVPNTFPGMAFLSAKHLVRKTKLFQILLEMPKGALLHAHLDAMVDSSYLLGLALKQPAMFIRVHQRLTPDTLSSILPEFHALRPEEYTKLSSLTSPDYGIGQWVNISHARENFDLALGGPEGFDSWVLGALTINATEAYNTYDSYKKIWKKFQSIFVTAAGLIRYAPIWGDYIREFFRASVEDGISYIEARITFADSRENNGMTGANGEAITYTDMCRIFENAFRDVKVDLEARGRGAELIGARIIHCALRFVSIEEMKKSVDDCIQLKKEFPHLIAGFDLVGHEDGFNPLVHYIEPLLYFKRRVQEEGLDLPLILHAGETLGDGSHADNNLYDAILLGTKRIGHGFSLAKHPKLIETVKDKGITIEVCPISLYAEHRDYSNEILRLTSSMTTHPLPVLINNGVQVSLSSDDPSIFGNMGLSYDFFQVLVASDITGLITLGDIARQSLESSTLNEGEKSKALDSWERRWAEFVKKIVDGTIVPS